MQYILTLVSSHGIKLCFFMCFLLNFHNIINKLLYETCIRMQERMAYLIKVYTTNMSSSKCCCFQEDRHFKVMENVEGIFYWYFLKILRDHPFQNSCEKVSFSKNFFYVERNGKTFLITCFMALLTSLMYLLFLFASFL